MITLHGVRFRRAFTLVELLVVIAIIGVLIAMLLPAVQKVRESANRARCMSNLHNVAVAAHTYQSTYGTLPPGYDAQQFGVLVYLLPFLEQENVFRQFNGGVPPFAGTNTTGLTDTLSLIDYRIPGGTWATGQSTTPYTPFWCFPAISPPVTYSSTLPLGQTANSYPTNADIAVLICPSGVPRSGQIFCEITSDYTSPVDVYFYDAFGFEPVNSVMGRTHYLGVAAITGWTGPDATYKALFDFESSNSLQNIPDGASNTLLFGECAGWPNNANNESQALNGENIPGVTGMGGYFGTSWTCGVLHADWGLQNNKPSPSYMPGATENGQHFNFARASGLNGVSYTLFISNHSGGLLQFAFADGSVHTIDPNIDYFIFIALGGYADGVAANVGP